MGRIKSLFDIQENIFNNTFTHWLFNQYPAIANTIPLHATSKPKFMMHTLFATTLISCAFLASCSNDSAKPTQTNEALPFDKQWARSFIDSINSVFSNNLNHGDSAALASLYWPDAELLLDNSAPVKGPDILNAWGSVVRMGIKKMNFATTDITGSAEFIIETGNYEMKDDKDSLLDRGKYVVVWEKRNGQWKLYRDIGCTSLPLVTK